MSKVLSCIEGIIEAKGIVVRNPRRRSQLEDLGINGKYDEY
jgi:hypothetical protein